MSVDWIVKELKTVDIRHNQAILHKIMSNNCGLQEYIKVITVKTDTSNRTSSRLDGSMQDLNKIHKIQGLLLHSNLLLGMNSRVPH